MNTQSQRLPEQAIEADKIPTIQATLEPASPRAGVPVQYPPTISQPTIVQPTQPYITPPQARDGGEWITMIGAATIIGIVGSLVVPWIKQVSSSQLRQQERQDSAHQEFMHQVMREWKEEKTSERESFAKLLELTLQTQQQTSRGIDRTSQGIEDLKTVFAQFLEKMGVREEERHLELMRELEEINSVVATLPKELTEQQTALLRQELQSFADRLMSTLTAKNNHLIQPEMAR